MNCDFSKKCNLWTAPSLLSRFCYRVPTYNSNYARGPSLYYVSKRTERVGLKIGHFFLRLLLCICWHSGWVRMSSWICWRNIGMFSSGGSYRAVQLDHCLTETDTLYRVTSFHKTFFWLAPTSSRATLLERLKTKGVNSPQGKKIPDLIRLVGLYSIWLWFIWLLSTTY